MGYSELVVIRYDPITGPPERVRFEPRPDGQWTRIEEAWSGCRWRPRGREIVAAVAVE